MLSTTWTLTETWINVRQSLEIQSFEKKTGSIGGSTYSSWLLRVTHFRAPKVQTLHDNDDSRCGGLVLASNVVLQ